LTSLVVFLSGGARLRR